MGIRQRDLLWVDNIRGDEIGSDETVQTIPVNLVRAAVAPVNARRRPGHGFRSGGQSGDDAGDHSPRPIIDCSITQDLRFFTYKIPNGSL